MTLVQLEHVSKTYRNHVEVPALRDVTVSMDKGEFAAVVGPSGSGKTTLLNMVGALDKPDEGVIRIAGLDLTATPPDKLADFRLRHLGFVFQAYNLFPVLTVLENLEFVPTLQKMPKPERRSRAHATGSGRHVGACPQAAQRTQRRATTTRVGVARHPHRA